jgi:dTMP kinase
MFIVLEGIDGAGTTTMTHFLGEYLTKKGLEVITTFEPWTSVFGKEIRRRLIAEKEAYINGMDFLRLFVEDSAIHNRELIKPALKENKIVISDRYRVSSFVYQQVQGIPLEQIIKMHEEKDLELPNLTFYLQLDIGKALKRKKIVEKFDISEFLVKVADNYQKMIDMHLKYLGKVITINADLSLEEVKSNLFRSFDEFYKNYSVLNLNLGIRNFF